MLDVKLALVALVCFPFLLLLTRWFRKESAKTYRVTRETVALVIVHFVESMLASARCRPSAASRATRRSSTTSTTQYRDANLGRSAWSPGSCRASS